MDSKVFERYESEVRSYCRKFPVVFDKARGSEMFDENGEAYLDFFCGAGAVNYGHNNDYIRGRVVEYLLSDGITHAMDMYTAAKGSFIDFFQEKILKPRALDYKVMFTGPTGTNANEAAVKLARKVTGRTEIFALMGAFHGMTLGSLAMTSDRASRKGAGVPLGNVTRIPAPGNFKGLDTIEYMEALLADDHSGVEKPAALIVEAVQAEGGVNPLPVEWLRRAREFCDHHDILLICDEVQIANGRCGKFFAFEWAGIRPDIVTLSKSIGGMGMPLALCLFRPELDVWSPGEHNGTFRGFQPAIVAAKAGLEFLLDHDIEAEVRRKGKLVDDFFAAELPKISDRLTHRGLGLMWGVDFAAYPPGTAKKVSAECFKRHLVIELAGREDCVLKLMPPLTIGDEDLLRGLRIIVDAIRALNLEK